MPSMRVVIADDSKIIRDRVCAYLGLGGYTLVGAAANGKEAYDLCVLQRPDIAIFDVSMPVMNGDIAALRVMKEKLARFVIVATSQVQQATLDPVIAAGGKVIAKPFYDRKFLHELSEIVSAT